MPPKGKGDSKGGAKGGKSAGKSEEASDSKGKQAKGGTAVKVSCLSCMSLYVCGTVMELKAFSVKLHRYLQPYLPTVFELARLHYSICILTGRSDLLPGIPEVQLCLFGTNPCFHTLATKCA